jgi:hypothetical protein
MSEFDSSGVLPVRLRATIREQFAERGHAAPRRL